jgi:hypothetical protein
MVQIKDYPALFYKAYQKLGGKLSKADYEIYSTKFNEYSFDAYMGDGEKTRERYQVMKGDQVETQRIFASIDEVIGYN